MSSSNNRQRKSTNVDRRITSHIRRLHLNARPDWFMVRSRSKDPPIYNEDVKFNRKLRVITGVGTSGLDWHVSDILSALPGVASFSVSEIMFYGAGAAASSTITVRARANLPTLANSTSPRTFQDTGVPGQSRSKVHLRFPNTHLVEYGQANLTTILFNLVLRDESAAQITGDVIMDFVLQCTHGA